MAEVAGSVGIVEAGSTPAPTGAAATDPAGEGKGFSFVDGESGADSAEAILDEVLTGDAPAEGETTETPVEGEKPKPAPAAAAETPEALQLRKGFAKLADERQKLLEAQNAARAERQGAQQFAEKAKAHDTLVARLKDDPAGVIAELGDEAINKALQGFIDREKSPTERRIDELEKQTKAEKAAALQAEQERVAANWREGIARQVRADERFDLINTFDLHNDVIDVITSYYEKHSERDDSGNVVVPAILSWDVAAQAVEDNKAATLEGKSKRYGKRAPAAAPSTTPAKTPPAPAKRATTSLSSVPTSEGPSREDDLPVDDLDERERRILAELG